MSLNLLAAFLLRQPRMCSAVSATKLGCCLMFDLFTRTSRYFSAKLLSFLLATTSAAVRAYSVPDAELAFAFLELPGIFWQPISPACHDDSE